MIDQRGMASGWSAYQDPTTGDWKWSAFDGGDARYSAAPSRGEAERQARAWLASRPSSARGPR